MDEVKPKNRCSDVMLTELLRIVNFNKCEGKLSRYAIAYIHSVVKVDEGTLKTLANENSYMVHLFSDRFLILTPVKPFSNC